MLLFCCICIWYLSLFACLILTYPGKNTMLEKGIHQIRRAKKSSSLRNPTYHVGTIIWATVNRAGGPTASCKQECISLFWGENLLFDGPEIRRSHVWHVWNPVNSGIFTISPGAGFLPSTVCAYKLLLSDNSYQPTWHQHSIISTPSKKKRIHTG